MRKGRADARSWGVWASAAAMVAALCGPAAAQPGYASEGKLLLRYGATLDLDRGQINGGEKRADLILTRDARGRDAVAPMPRAFIAMLGERRPNLNDCLAARYTDQTVPLHRFRPARYFCVRTNQGRVAVAQVLAHPKRGRAASIKLSHRTYAKRLGATRSQPTSAPIPKPAPR